MTISQIAQQVTTEKSAVQIRFRDGGKGEAKQYNCKPLFSGSRRGWTVLDTTTSGAIMAVYKGLRDDLKPSFDTIPLSRLIDFCWRMVA